MAAAYTSWPGYIHRADIRKQVRAEANGKTAFDFVYSTGPDHFRVVSGSERACRWLRPDVR